MSVETPHVLFELPGQATGSVFALDCAQVAQVLELHTMTSVPMAPSIVRGIINHNGRIVAAVDACPLLGLPAAVGPSPQLVLLRRDEARKTSIGLMVATIREIVPRSMLAHVDVKPGPCIAYVAQWKRLLVHVVNLEPLLEVLGRQFSPRERGESLGVVP